MSTRGTLRLYLENEEPVKLEDLITIRTKSYGEEEFNGTLKDFQNLLVEEDDEES